MDVITASDRPNSSKAFIDTVISQLTNLILETPAPQERLRQLGELEVKVRRMHLRLQRLRSARRREEREEAAASSEASEEAMDGVHVFCHQSVVDISVSCKGGLDFNFSIAYIGD